MTSDYRLILWRKVLTAVALTVAVVGCSSVRPYASRSSWVMRQNAVPQYFAAYDVFYVYPVQPEESVWASKAGATALYDDVKQRACGALGKRVRVFAPCVRESAAATDAAEALAHYLKSYHDAERPFHVLLEGRDEAFEAAFRKEAGKKLSEGTGFVSLQSAERFEFGPELTLQLSEAVRQRALTKTWGQSIREAN